MILAAVMAALAVSCLVRSPAPRRLVAGPGRRRRGSRLWPVVLAFVPPVLGYLLGGSSAFAIAVALELVLLTVTRLVVTGRRRRRALRDAAEIAHGCQVLAGQLRVGRVPVDALAVAAEDCPILQRSHRLHQLGDELPRIWWQESVLPGRSGLATLARAWQVSEGTGAAMQRLLQLVAVELAREHRIAGTVESELAGARASARLLSVLPLVGLVLGFVLGGDPVAFIVGQRLGQVCLVVAAALVCAGLLWVERISQDRATSGRVAKEES